MHAMHNDRKLQDGRLNIYDSAEMNFWAREFGVSTSQLMRAVDNTGTSIEAVRNALALLNVPVELAGQNPQARVFWHGGMTP